MGGFDELSRQIQEPQRLTLHLHPEPVEGCNIAYCMASTSSAAKFKRPKTPSPELVMEKSYFYEEYIFQHPLVISEKPL